MEESRIRREFFRRDSCLVARDLLGKVLCRSRGETTSKGKIVETEAYYGPGDPASHASSGKTSRSAIMWGQPGIAYVYFVYGNHFLFNVVTEERGEAGAVLLRALEPVEGVEEMRQLRGFRNLQSLTDGPGKLCEALGITKQQNGLDLVNSDTVWVQKPPESPTASIRASPRIGVSLGQELEYRFYLAGNPYLSR
ncbi:MAG: DNA-3-methyladenine glycosylase [Candidatus Acetothermia bacterium]